MARTIGSIRGKLQLEKCFYYVLSWQFDSKGNPYPRTVTEQRAICPQIQIPTSNGTAAMIIQKEVSEAHPTLGCRKAIDGNQEEQEEFIRARIRNFALAIKDKGLTQYTYHQ
jgi:hypothetical protein